MDIGYCHRQWQVIEEREREKNKAVGGVHDYFEVNMTAFFKCREAVTNKRI